MPRKGVQRLSPNDALVCPCGVETPLPAYVAAHWEEKILFTCRCGKLYWIERGKVTPK